MKRALFRSQSTLSEVKKDVLSETISRQITDNGSPIDGAADGQP